MKRILIPLCLTLLAGCSSATTPVNKDFFAMDAMMSATLYGKEAEDASVALQQELNRLDGLWSRTKPKSDVSQLNQASGATVSAETTDLLDMATAVHTQSGGAFNPNLGKLMDLWDFTGEHPSVPSKAAIEEALNTPDLDLGGIAKGAAAGYVADILKQYHIENGLVSLGTSTVYSQGTQLDGNPWRIGIRDPQGGNDSLAIFSLESGHTCSTSGAYQRYFEQDGQIYHHIIDPQTGYPSDSDLASVTVVSEEGALTDAWSTAFFVLGLDRALETYESQGLDQQMELILVTTDGQLIITDGLSADFSFRGEGMGYTYAVFTG